MGTREPRCTRGTTVEHTLELAGKIARNSPTALAAAIRAVNAGYEHGANGMQREIEEFGKCFGTADFVGRDECVRGETEGGVQGRVER